VCLSELISEVQSQIHDIVPSNMRLCAHEAFEEEDVPVEVSTAALGAFSQSSLTDSTVTL